MIERVSRYYDGPLAQPKKKYTGESTIAVFRKFPDSVKTSYMEYVWEDGNNLSTLANVTKGGSKFWWEIMDINPSITDPFSIEPGEKIYLPYGY